MNAVDSHLVADQKTAITIMSNLGSLYVNQGRLDEAVQLHERSHQTAIDVYGGSHIITMQTGWRNASTLDKNNDHQRALDVLAPLLSELEKAKASNPQSLLSPYRLQARIYRHKGNIQLARNVLNKALDIANTRPSEFTEAIRKIKRDIRRLDK